MKSLSVREQKFVEAYLETGNVCKAVVNAGYGSRGVSGTAYRLMSRDRVKAAIETAQQELAAKTSRTRERMMSELEAIIEEANKGKHPNYAAILKAKEMQCKMLGFFDSGKVEVNINTSFAAVGTPQGGAETDG